MIFDLLQTTSRAIKTRGRSTVLVCAPVLGLFFNRHRKVLGLNRIKKIEYLEEINKPFWF